MAEEWTDKRGEEVETFSVPVSGGTFYVSEVFLAPGENREEVIAFIRNTPEDRWFVMVSENPDDALDSLAMIDDNLEFQILARGQLKQD